MDCKTSVRRLYCET